MGREVGNRSCLVCEYVLLGVLHATCNEQTDQQKWKNYIIIAVVVRRSRIH